MSMNDEFVGHDAPAGRSERRVEPSVREAIAWMVNLQSDETTQIERAEFAVWYNASRSHAAAWDRLSGSLGPLKIASEDGLLPNGAVSRRILDRDANRRTVLRTTAMSIAAFAVVAGANRVIPLPELLADHVTWTGQRAQLPLEGGAQLTLGPRSAVNIVRGADHDKIEVVSGQVFLALPETPLKAIRLAVANWSISPGTGRTVVFNRGAVLSASALDAPMTVDIARAGMRAVEGGQTLLSDDGQLRIEPADIDVETAWTRGLLVVRNRLLSDLVDLVKPSYVGIIRMTPEAARLRIGGIYRLDDPVQMFKVMAETVPLRVREITPFWISLDVTSI